MRNRVPGLRIALAGFLLAFAACPVLAGGKNSLPYSYFVTGTAYFTAGNPTPLTPLPKPVPKPVQALVLMGGGPDVDAAYRWMISNAGISKATGGRFVVIRTTGTDAYDPYLMYSNTHNSTSSVIADGFVGGASMGLTSAETLIIPSAAAANDPFVNAVVSTANALWIAGGDQSTYINDWKGTKLQATLQALIAKGIPFGGTSAGANVLGQFVYSAEAGSVLSTQALADPYNSLMSFDPTPFSNPSFLGPGGGSPIAALADTFVDPHFDARDRMGRLVTFVSRTIGPAGCTGGILNPPAARGIGIDVETALLVSRDPNSASFVAQRVTNPSTTSSSYVYFLSGFTQPTQCAAGKPLTMNGAQVQRLTDSATVFNLSNWWSGSFQLPPYQVQAINGVLNPANPY
jgi:cyanophycinase-like exopeptidase